MQQFLFIQQFEKRNKGTKIRFVNFVVKVEDYQKQDWQSFLSIHFRFLGLKMGFVFVYEQNISGRIKIFVNDASFRKIKEQYTNEEIKTTIF